MDMRHIDYLCREIKSIRKGSIETIRILGGEPLLSKILEPAVQAFELLKDEGYISNINIYQALTSRSGMESCVLPHN